MYIKVQGGKLHQQKKKKKTRRRDIKAKKKWMSKKKNVNKTVYEKSHKQKYGGELEEKHKKKNKADISRHISAS